MPTGIGPCWRSCKASILRARMASSSMSCRASIRRAARFIPSRRPASTSSTTTSSGAPRSRCRRAAGSASSTAPITRKPWSYASIPSCCRSNACRRSSSPTTSGAALRGHQQFRAHLARNGMVPTQILPQHLQGGAIAAPAGAHRRSRKRLEVPGSRRRGAQAVGRIYRRLRPHHPPHRDQARALACRARRSQMVLAPAWSPPCWSSAWKRSTCNSRNSMKPTQRPGEGAGRAA